MNIIYKVLWIDDSDGFVEVTKLLLEDAVSENSMKSDIVVYGSYEEYSDKELKKFDPDVFNMYDLILVDYALSSEYTGDNIIRDLRNRDIYTDIVFYSSDYSGMKQKIISSKEPLDGVFLTKRENLVETVVKVIKKNLKREFNIANIRGLLMDSTSEFDFICRTVSLDLFEKLEEDKKKEVLREARTYIENTKKSTIGTFNKLEDLKESKFLKAVMESVDFVITNKDRYSLLTSIIRESGVDSPISNDDFSEEYRKDLIKPRNDLAHNKLFYGECKKKIHKANKKMKFKCNTDCEHCTGGYSIDECKKLRSKMFEYYNIFEDLFENE